MFLTESGARRNAPNIKHDGGSLAREIVVLLRRVRMSPTAHATQRRRTNHSREAEFAEVNHPQRLHVSRPSLETTVV